jgi:hypothetical protein
MYTSPTDTSFPQPEFCEKEGPMLFYMCLVLAGCWPLVARMIYPDKFTWTEITLQISAAAVIAFAGWQVGLYAKAAAVELLNGEVISKYEDQVSCTHSYSCNCKEICTGEGKDRTCSTSCDTCYQHPFDIDWVVDTNVGDFKIDRIDAQGWWEPPRWTKVQKGQPVAREHVYMNYVAAQKDSLYHKQEREMVSLPPVPPYPRVYDYQYADRVLAVNVAVPELPLWQADVANALKELGPHKQANLMVMIVATPDQNYRAKVEAAWRGANKNDVTVIIGVEPGNLTILWADVITFADNIGNEELRVQLRNTLLDVGTVDRTKILPLVFDHVRRFYNRPHMKDFDYLKNDMEPDTWYQIVFGILFLVVNIGLTWFFREFDVSLSGIQRTEFRGFRARRF